jgi:hypothetical protein
MYPCWLPGLSLNPPLAAGGRGVGMRGCGGDERARSWFSLPHRQPGSWAASQATALYLEHHDSISSQFSMLPVRT